ncbi:hypothetical protein FLAVO9AF_220021 [Flavobacterium sp. 9AF]|uniref:hypothetical protein n=1 Tax=Flavobacterium sp. 9AF TaxID=2653142 RepID=UPI0012F3A8C8|nr:hypothetical protein [Flavobacterium sp. 9AF]VXB59538.1 hypothetical protein FLAVO9AF_220021 [Flavobacterium sp. 9AF]
MTEKLTTQQRKKCFDILFKEKIVPFFENRGFDRYSKTTKRIYKDLGSNLTVFIYFEYKTFGKGFYDITISYYDSDFGKTEEDTYLVMAQIKKPTIKGVTEKELEQSTDNWLVEIDSKIIPFIEQHATHKAILNSNLFYISKFREKERLDILERKSK